MPEKKSPAHRGPRTKWITIRCVVCDEAKEVTREDAVCCSARCRKRRSRHLLGEDIRVVQTRSMRLLGILPVGKAQKKGGCNRGKL